ncbi:hypothetical protein EXU85_03655 [Spirosoma sp. KCTC 42546]|uniref:hypothetical protein n=1 Tax=Spirosoma sp. KCTC 42546 TaxID=2520506 RepID=UPI00115A9752|nr:hypothetical protein [Spirosoma sp. KCTC 42546]QDK77738.1 hypothetical protein EXU85_03655 [Spirosoma sp. KCTC 42546]
MKNLYCFLICFLVTLTGSFGQKPSPISKSGQTQAPIDTTKDKTINKGPILEKQVTSLRDSLRVLKATISQKEAENKRLSIANDNANQLLESERKAKEITNIQNNSLKQKADRHARDSVEIAKLTKEKEKLESALLSKSKDDVEQANLMNKQSELLKNRTEQHIRDSIQISDLKSYKEKQETDLNSYKQSKVEQTNLINRQNELLKVKADQRSKDSIQIAMLTNEKQQIQNDLKIKEDTFQKERTALQIERDKQRVDITNLIKKGNELNTKLLGRLEAGIFKAINSIELSQPEDYKLNLDKFRDLQQECKSLSDQIPKDGQLARQCVQVDKYISLLETLDKARLALDKAYNEKQVSTIIADLNSRKGNDWNSELKTKTNDYINFLNSYNQLTKDIACHIRAATVAFDVDKKKASDKLQLALDIVGKSSYTYLEREVINRQKGNKKPDELIPYELIKKDCK